MLDKINVSTIFCDDIRREIGDKYSLMGCYDTRMELDEFPTVLPRLCVVIYAIIQPDAAIENITLWGTIGSDALPAYSVPQRDMEAAQVGRPRKIITLLTISPLQLMEPSVLTIKMNVDGKEAQIGALVIEMATAEVVASNV